MGQENEAGKPTYLRRIWYNDSEESDNTEGRSRRRQHKALKQKGRRREKTEGGRKERAVKRTGAER